LKKYETADNQRVSQRSGMFREKVERMCAKILSKAPCQIFLFNLHS